MKEGPLKGGLFNLLRHSGAIRVAQALARGVPILAYHGVTANEGNGSNQRRLQVPLARFEQHLEFLSAHHHPLALTDLLGLLAAGQRCPRRAVVVTFDDGYRNFATRAWPLLQRYGVPATLFVVGDGGSMRFWQDRVESALLTARVDALDWRGARLALGSLDERQRAAVRVVGSLEGPRVPTPTDLAPLFQQTGEASEPDEDRDRLDWDELRALRAQGLAIGSHGDRHEPLTGRDEAPGAILAEAHAVLTRELGTGEYALSYPFGARDPTICRAARSAGFSCALSGRPALARPAQDLYDLPRLLLGADDDLLRLRLSLSGLRARWQADPWPMAAERES